MSKYIFQSIITRKIQWQMMLVCSSICLLLLSSCTNAVEQTGIESLAAITQTVITPTSTQSITPTNLPTSTKTPESTGDYVNMIQNIDDNVLVYQEIGHGAERSIEFSILDFSTYDGNMLDIREHYYNFPISTDISFIQFNKNDQSFIYEAWDYSGPNNFIFKHTFETQTTKQITFNQSTYFSQLSPDGTKISYQKGIDKLYVIDGSGYGRQIAPEIAVKSRGIFSADGEEIIFVGEPMDFPEGCTIDDDFETDMYLYLVNLNEPNNPIQISSDWVQKGNCGKQYSGVSFTWIPNSHVVLYNQLLEDQIKNICKIDLNSMEETCLSDQTFIIIDQIVPASEKYVLISGMPSISDCMPCTYEEMNTDLFILNLDTGEMILNSDGPFSARTPEWIANDQFIVYEYYGNDTWQIYITDKTGSFHQPLTNSELDTYLLN